MAISRAELDFFLTDLLEPESYKDYGPNGLQIEGREQIQRIAFAVSATAASAREAVNWQADALIVHHGLFWKFHGPRTLTGPFARRVLPLARAEINLWGYHLPLDANLEVGNAAGIARRLGFADMLPFGDHEGMPIGVQCRFAKTNLTVLAQRLEDLLQHPILIASPDANAEVSSMGIITGGANGQWTQALAEKLDCYLTGEMSEHDWHEAQESGMHMLAGGHNATESFGVQDLKERIEAQFEGLETTWFPSPNPA